MLKTDQLDKLEQLSKSLGIRSVLHVAYTEGYADAYRLAFQHTSDRKTVNFLNDAPERVAEITRNSFIKELESRPMSSWSNAELFRYTALTGQFADGTEPRTLADMEHAGISESYEES